jgi:hypothetical protein
MIGLVVMLSLAAAEPESFTVTIPVSPETAEGRLLIARRAAEHCRGRYPQLGRYRFEGRERLGAEGASSFEVRQELHCLDLPPPVVSAPPAPAGWRSTAQDEERVSALTQHYFALVDAGDAEQVHRLWSEGEREATPLADRAAAIEAFRRQAGRPGAHRIVRTTWYVNPQNAPRPGIYVAVDYERSYSGLHLNCGYLVWFREAEDRYILLREDTAILARDGSDHSAESLAELRRQMRCDGR